jgi:hypothetical protein
MDQNQNYEPSVLKIAAVNVASNPSAEGSDKRTKSGKFTVGLILL